MTTRLISTAALLATMAMAAAQDRFQQEAYLIFSQEDIRRVWIGDANEQQFLYYETPRGVDSKQMKLQDPAVIWWVEPAAFAAVRTLDAGRRYEEALEAVRTLKRTYEPLREMKGNYASLAAFHELELLQKLERHDELAKALRDFTPRDRASLRHPYRVEQLEIFELWARLARQEFPALEKEAAERLRENPLPAHRAQLEYLRGRAMEGRGDVKGAMEAYQLVALADNGASEVVTADAMLRLLALYQADEEVQAAIKLAGTEEASPHSAGARKLREAGGLARLFEMSLGGGRPLPEKFQELRKHAPDLQTAAKE